jgi:hypothetical protein
VRLNPCKRLGACLFLFLGSLFPIFHCEHLPGNFNNG